MTAEVLEGKVIRRVFAVYNYIFIYNVLERRRRQTSNGLPSFRMQADSLQSFV